MSDDKGTSLPATVTVTVPATLPANFTVQAGMALVRDLAHNFYDEDVIFKNHGLTKEQGKALLDNQFFKQALVDAAKEWNSPMSTEQRLARQAAAMVEDAMPKIGARMSDRNEPLREVVEVAKLFAKIAGLGEEKEKNSNERFSITINLGADQKLHYDKSSDNVVEVQPLPQGSSTD